MNRRGQARSWGAIFMVSYLSSFSDRTDEKALEEPVDIWCVDSTQLAAIPSIDNILELGDIPSEQARRVKLPTAGSTEEKTSEVP